MGLIYQHGSLLPIFALFFRLVRTRDRILWPEGELIFRSVNQATDIGVVAGNSDNAHQAAQNDRFIKVNALKRQEAQRGKDQDLN